MTGRRLVIAGGLGLVVLLVVTSVAALLHLNQVPNGEGAWARFVAPALSTVGLGSVGYLAFRDLGALFGVRGNLWLLPVALTAVALLGAAHALVLRAVRPVIYAGIGQGGAPVVITPKVPRPRDPQEPQEPREPGAHRPERVNR